MIYGVGGVFLKSADPRRLVSWYKKHLGIAFAGTAATFQAKDMPKDACTVLGVFPTSSGYFSPSKARCMVNFVVDDVEATLKRAARGGAKIVGEVQSAPYGRFGWFLDPDRNKVELWEPPSATRRLKKGRREKSDG